MLTDDECLWSLWSSLVPHGPTSHAALWSWSGNKRNTVTIHDLIWRAGTAMSVNLAFDSDPRQAIAIHIYPLSF